MGRPSRTEAPRPWWVRAAPLALVAFCYLATSPYQPALNNPNEMVRVYMTKAIVEHRTTAIDDVVRDWGDVNDKATREGRLYSSKAPLQSLVGVPILAALRLFGGGDDKHGLVVVLRFFGSVLPVFALAAALHAYAMRRTRELGVDRRLGVAVALALALGTMLYPYAITFQGHGLAAATAGGAYLAALAHARSGESERRWWAVLIGFLAAAAPFAEYPAALVALPAALAPLWIARGARERLGYVLHAALGGALPLALGLAAHASSWGSPLRTGYSFLANPAFVEHHRAGFFGVRLPRLEGFWGALFSPGTGLLYFSPVLTLGFAGLVAVGWPIVRGAPAPRPDAPASIPRPLVVAAMVGVLAEVLFLSGHTAWRGGWTLGPRYIVPVVPVLGVWVVEALARPWARIALPPLAAVSVLVTGAAAAIYPHLPDAFMNPVVAFVWPSYARGLGSYGLAHLVGLRGHAANLVHLAALAAAAALCVTAYRPRKGAARAMLRSLLVVVSMLGAMALLGEPDPVHADVVRERVWRTWEPR